MLGLWIGNLTVWIGITSLYPLKHFLFDPWEWPGGGVGILVINGSFTLSDKMD